MSDWIELKVDRIVEECELVKSLYLVDPDGGEIPYGNAGQFITLEIPATETRKRIRRSYTLSQCTNGTEYRVTVKKQLPPSDVPDAPAGIVSSILYDEVQEGDRFLALPPRGKFCIDTESHKPAVFLSIGIGITPMVAMLEAQLRDNPARKMLFINVVRTKSQEALLDQVRTWANAHQNLTLHVAYTRPQDTDTAGKDYDSTGRITPDKLRALLDDIDNIYYVCGTKEFAKNFGAELEAWGVPKDQIHLEGFGGPKVVRK